MSDSNVQSNQYIKKWFDRGGYYSQSRPEIVGLINKGDNRVLDVGCATGAVGHDLKNSGRAKLVYGIEGFADAASIAKTKLDFVHEGNLEAMDFIKLSRDWSGIKFDYIIFGDVLEHLQDPWSTLERCLPLLEPQGRVIVSLPNVRHWSVLVPLAFKGRWQYRENGILDRTHLRFFTKSSAEAFANDCGLLVREISMPIFGKKTSLISKLTLGLFDQFLAIQILIEAEPKIGGG